ncbi:MAG: lipoyl domain-containing protein [Paracoccaceae bacterium]|nr:lipoyl domain-containing protein [Paracoccaceae bacterium]MDE2915434.1 lipoyl domain-containing protein [Paracoccaceae bacterium]
MRVRLELARIGTTMEEGTIVRRSVAEGNRFKAGDILYELNTEKVTNDVEARGDRTVLELLVNEGDVALVGEDVCVVESL